MISPVTLSPTVLTKYPYSQNSPPHNSFLTSGNSLRISFALTALKILTTSAIEYRGEGKKKVHMIRVHFQFNEVKPMILSDLFKPFSDSFSYFSLKNPLAIFGSPHQVILGVIHTVAGSVDRHATILQDFCCLWQHAFFIPALPGGAFKCSFS